MSAFADAIDSGALTVQNRPDYIFLCGGPLNDFDKSLRAHFCKFRVTKNPLLLHRVQIAEKADEWYQSRKLFDDLLELEAHLAGLAACVLLFVESPGAIAEFGAFSQIEVLREKLVVVIEQSYFKRQSFIRNGLVESMRRTRPDSVLSYPWLSSPAGASAVIDPVGADETMDEVEKELGRILRKKPKTSAFRPGDHGHRMLLIADLIDLNVVVRQQEIHRLLKDLGVPVESKDLRKYLYLIEQLGLVSAGRYGNVDYYFGIDSAPEFITYPTAMRADRARLRTIIRADVPLTPQKAKALNAFRRRSAGTGTP